MSTTLAIRSPASPASIELTHPEYCRMRRGIRYFQVKLHAEGVCAWGRIEVHQPEGLVAFFEDLARPGRRLAGIASDAADLLLAGEVDRHGFAKITATLVCRHPDRDWYVKATVDVSLADLDDLARQARSFLRLPSAVESLN